MFCNGVFFLTFRVSAYKINPYVNKYFQTMKKTVTLCKILTERCPEAERVPVKRSVKITLESDPEIKWRVPVMAGGSNQGGTAVTVIIVPDSQMRIGDFLFIKRRQNTNIKLLRKEK